MTERYDIVIVGAGMVGATLACALARMDSLKRGNSDLKIAVIEAQSAVTEWPQDSTDLRVSAITPASQRIFTGLGVWDQMCSLRVSPFREMHVWDATGDGEIHFDSAEIGEPQLGHIIENRVIQTALLKRINDFDTIEFICPATLESVAFKSDLATLVLHGGRSIETRLVVGADGGRSQVRALAGIKTRGWQYDQKAVVATVQTRCSHQETAWQRFLPDGPLAFLPLGDGASAIVWSTTPDHADALLAMDESLFLENISEAFDYKLGEVTHVAARGVFPLSLQHAGAYVSDRLALIGDAAHTIHPLAGQGVNLGLLDAATLSEVLMDARDSGRDIGTRRVLRRYERWRKGDNVVTMLAMDGFKRLFATSVPPVQLLRNTGLTIANAIAPLKNQIMLHALGIKGDLPRLARYSRSAV